MIFKDDRLEVTFTYLEMHEAPSRPPAHPPTLNHPIMLTRIMEPTIGFYRYLYNAVGEPWLWYERRIMEDEKLLPIIHDDRIEIYCLFVGVSLPDMPSSTGVSRQILNYLTSASSPSLSEEALAGTFSKPLLI